MAGKDLTQGNITRQLVELAVPLMLGNILQQLYNTVDAFIIGRFCGREPYAAIGAISHISLRVLLSWLLVGRMGLDAVALATGLGWILVNLMWLLYKVLFMDRASHRPRNVLH